MLVPYNSRDWVFYFHVLISGGRMMHSQKSTAINLLQNGATELCSVLSCGTQLRRFNQRSWVEYFYETCKLYSQVYNSYRYTGTLHIMYEWVRHLSEESFIMWPKKVMENTTREFRWVIKNIPLVSYIDLSLTEELDHNLY